MTDSKTILIGKCEGSIMDAHVTVEKYAVMEENSARFAVLNITNNFNRPLTGLTLELKQYNAGGDVIRTTVEARKELLVQQGASLVIEETFPLASDCEEVHFTVLSATYGAYRYTPVGNGICAEYLSEAGPACSDEELCKKTDGTFSHAQSRLRFTPKQIAISALAILLLAFCSFLVYLEAFSAAQDEFVISNVVYRFTDKTRTSATVVGTRGYGKDIVIPEYIEGVAITEIEEKAFYKAKYLSTLQIKGDVRIGNSAFYGCPDLQSISLPAVSTVGNYAFFGCDRLARVEMSGVRTLGNSAFENCTALQSVSINGPESIAIGANVFAACRALHSFTAGQELLLDPYQKGIFTDSLALRELSLATFSLGDSGKDGIRVLFDGAKELALETLTINRIDYIPDGFCEDLRLLKTVRIADMKTASVGKSAFRGCVALSTFETPFAISTLGDFAFSATALEHFNSSGLTSIGASCFENATMLAEFSFPEAIRTIPQNFFANCVALKTVTFPAKCTTIRTGAFAGCLSLTSAIISSNDMQTIEPGAFLGCSALEKMRLPFLGQSISKPAPLNFLFGNNAPPASLKTVLVRAGEPCQGAFADASYLEEVVFEGSFTRLPGSVFAGCGRLRRVTLPSELQEIGTNAFSGCGNLRSITIPAGVETIGLGAFNGCIRLYEVVNQSPSFTVERGSSTVRGVAKSALAVSNANEEPPRHVKQLSCDFLSVDGGWYLIDYLGDQTTAILPGKTALQAHGILSYQIPARCFEDFDFVDLRIGDAIAEIGVGVFRACEDLTRVSFPSSLLRIGDNAFFGCPSLESLEFAIDTKLESIGTEAFFACSSLRSVVLPGTLSALGENAFAQCTSLVSVNLGNTLTLIPIGAFTNCTSLESVHFAPTVQCIEREAFAGCLALRTVDLSACRNLAEIKDRAFASCSSMITLALNDALSLIGTGAFGNATALLAVTLPASLQTLGAEAFRGCTALVSASLPQSLQQIGNNAFADCTSLQSAAFGETILAASLPDGLFRNCSSLEAIALPQGLRTIGASAFENCSALELVYLPQTITQIGANAFADCFHLYEIFNLSALTLSLKDTASHGGIAGYAYMIHTQNEQPMRKCKTDNMTLICPADTWLLVEYRSLLNYERITLDTASDGTSTVSAYTVTAGAFRFCRSIEQITLAAAVTAIEQEAFKDLYYLTSVTFTADSPVTEIPSLAFSGCRQLSKISLPPRLSTIGTWAFHNCDVLFSITLPESLRRIEENAFVGCSYLYEVFDLSPHLTITAGSGANGEVARNALIVHTDASAPKLELLDVTDQNCQYTFLKLLNEWYLFSYGGSGRTAYLPTKVAKNGVVHAQTYRIHDKAMSTLTSFAALMIPNTITATPGGFWSKFSALDSVYFYGTPSEWEAFCRSAGSTSATVYYYTDCVHESGTWSYTTAATITTAISQYTLTSKTEGTCVTKEQRVYTCPLCGDTRTETGDLGGHAPDANGVCIHCNKTVTPPSDDPNNGA